MLSDLLARLDRDLRTRLDDFALIPGIAVECMSPRIGAVHVLMAMLQDEGGVAATVFKGSGLTPAKLHDQLRVQFRGDGSEFPDAFAERWVDSTLWTALGGLADRPSPAQISESDLLAVVLEALEERVVKRLEYWLGTSVLTLAAEVRQRGLLEPSMAVLDERERIALDVFAPAARKSLQLAHREAQALGVGSVTREAVMLGALESDGLLPLALRAQSVDPMPIRENLMLTLGSRRVRKKQDYPLSRAHCRPNVIALLEEAALLATRDGRETIEEAHLVRALVTGTYGFVQQILSELRVDVPRLLEFAHGALSWDSEDVEVPPATPPSLAETEAALRSSMVGQDAVIDRILPLIKRLQFGHRRPGKPGGVFLFMGKSGTGKTMLAKAIAKAVYGSEDALIMLEMGQFKTDISINMFIGAPPGYVGYGQGKLTNGLRDKPECVVLFDEVEKAGEQVYDALLRFLDEGMISDPAGPVRDGSHCLIVLTSNIAADALSDLAQRMERGDDPDVVQAELRERALSYFKRPELINRIDDLILFSPLGRAEYAQILDRELALDLEWLQSEKGIQVAVDDDCREWLTDLSFARSEEGARVVGKVLTTRLISPLIDHLTAEGATGPIRLRAVRDGARGIDFQSARGDHD